MATFDFLNRKKGERAVSFDKVYEDVFDLVQLADMAEGTRTRLYDIYYDDSVNRFFALGIRDGVVYKIEIIPQNNDVLLGEYIEVTAADILPRSTQGSTKFRTYEKDGELRWLSIASVAVLNRVGEIDSRALFDNFISFAHRTGVYPVLNVYHLGEGSEIGRADLLARRGFVYIASGTFHNDKYGRAFFKALQTREDWGNSIEFYAPSYDLETVEFEGVTMTVPVYKKGVNTGITILKEKDAASVFTLHKSKGGK